MATDADWAWAAGLFEGEGFTGEIWVLSGPSRKRVYPRLIMEMTDEDVVRRFAAIAGFGRVHCRPRKNTNICDNPKPVWRWEKTGGWDNYVAFYEHIRPWLGERRRERFEAVLALRGQCVAA